MRGCILPLALVLVAAGAVAQERQWGQDRSIEQISEHVYRWGSDNQFGAYVLTSDGIIVVDGHYCPSGTVEWLKGELARRHAVPVRFVVLSHDHQDHVCHTQVFLDTAVAIGHRNIVPHLVRERRISAVPAITFDSELDLTLGGVRVTLVYLGPSHSDNLIHVHVPGDRVLISIDVGRDSLFPDLRDLDVHAYLRQLPILARWPDVEIVLPGHGRPLTQEAFTRTHAFLSALHDRVLALMVEGRPLPEIRRLIAPADFAAIGINGLERSLDANVVTMYDYLYRYREPNERITEREAVACIENSAACRTAD